MIKVYMAIPSTGTREDFHTYLFEQLRERYRDEVQMVFPDNCQQYFGHDYMRNAYVDRFLETDCDVMWFLDSDVIPPPHIFDLLTIHWNKDWLAAGAPYPLWLYRPGTQDMAVQYTVYNGNAPDENGNHGFSLGQVPSTGTEWVDGLATGCLFLKRELFTQLQKPYFQFKRNPETMEIIEGEDLGFALKLQKLGIKYFVDHGMVCGHYKRINLLEVQNYATDLSNHKLVAFHEQIKQEVEEAVKYAAAEGYRQGRAAALKEQGRVPNVSRTGLILPNSLST